MVVSGIASISCYNTATYHEDTALDAPLLAYAKQPETSKPGKKAGNPLQLLSYNEKSQLRNVAGNEWNKGIAAFAAGDMHKASGYFINVLEHNNTLSVQDKAALAFWAYRSLINDNRDAEAKPYLEQAAENAETFYGLIARQISGKKTVPVNAEINIAMHDLAKGLAKDTDVTPHALLPDWEPKTGYSVEPALLFAIIRQESNFNIHTQNSGGAVGVMQLMPQTIKTLAKKTNIKGTANEPAVNIALGQDYIKRLMQEPLIQDNLIFLTVAYNAGSGTLQKWVEKMDYNEDPLLFVEMLPFGATRDYVVNVMSNYWIYSEILGGNTNALSMITDGKWPGYAGIAKQTHFSANK